MLKVTVMALPFVVLVLLGEVVSADASLILPFEDAPTLALPLHSVPNTKALHLMRIDEQIRRPF